MSELEYQLATLAARHIGLWLVGAQLVVGLLQTGVVAWGIRAMILANRERAKAAADERREAAEARREAAEARREAAEAAAEDRRRADQRHAETMEALKAQSRALEVLIERTAPRADR